MTTAKKPTRAVKSSTKKKSAPRKKPIKNKPQFKQRLWSWFWRLSILFILLLSVWLVYLDAQVRSQFDGNKWALPAKVYARPLSLYPGLLLSAKQLKAELQWNDYKAVSHVVKPGTYGRDGNDWIIYRRGFSFSDRTEEPVKIRLSFAEGRIEQISVAGNIRGLERIEPQYIGGIFPAHNEDRDLIALQDVPPALVAALVAVEDRGYFDHYGISIRGILRALKANIAAGRTVQGGSTLTQQLVKNFFLTNERSLQRKIKEAFMALLLELHYSKEEILQAYLNEVYLGQSGRRSINGIALASRFYFAKSVQQLDLSEMALLVGMVKGPSYYNPFRHPERARERRDLVLGIMEELSIINSAQRINAQGKDIQVADSSRAGQREYPAFIQLVKKQLQQDYRLQDLQSTGLRIFTTLDPWLQHATETSVQKHISNLEKRIGFKDPTLEAAAVVTSVDGAEVRAIVGSRRVQYFGFNRAMDAQRSIGSLAKPAVYLTALSSGRYNWSTIIDDKPVSVSGQDGSLWQPRNYDRKNYGPVFLVDAMSKSLNQATARLGMTVGIDQVINTFERLGIDKDVPPYPSILLGSVAMSPLQVTQMFQTYASGGFAMEPRSIQALTTTDNKILTSYAAQGEQMFSPHLMENLRYGLQQVIAQGTGKRLARTFNTTKIAGKTGTSDEQRDAWFAGFDDRHLGVIWVGRDDNKPMPFTGAGGALPIWQDIFLQSGLEPLTPLVQLDWAWVNTQGEVVEPECGVRQMPFMPGVLNGRRISCDKSSSSANSDSRLNDQQNDNKGSSSWFDWLF
ncbi:MAG TPA: penicillin-binding protein 1B [Oceanospirillales bacterium]|nr:penicillin-binding protein 1B [Oceanospirillales bacterium]|tara:strand:+ start:906 stop:3293 length:2388 start_codon:yes stop_codon:yes gene_type:complete